MKNHLGAVISIWVKLFVDVPREVVQIPRDVDAFIKWWTETLPDALSYHDGDNRMKVDAQKRTEINSH